MSWQVTVFLSVLFIWGTRVLIDWLSVREQRRERDQAAAEKPAHTCLAPDLETIDAKPLTSDMPIGFHQTVVMRRCRTCGHHFVFTYNGKWSTEDFLKTQADAKWLKEQIG